MKHYVLGFIFNKAQDRVLLVEKRKPEWQAGHWNGIGGKIEENDKDPSEAMEREAIEETGITYNFKHVITHICPGGTVFIFTNLNFLGDGISFSQTEDEQLKIWDVCNLPNKIMANLLWIIPICLSTIQFPLLVLDTTLGVE